MGSRWSCAGLTDGGMVTWLPSDPPLVPTDGEGPEVLVPPSAGNGPVLPGPPPVEFGPVPPLVIAGLAAGISRADDVLAAGAPKSSSPPNAPLKVPEPAPIPGRAGIDPPGWRVGRPPLAPAGPS